MVRRIDNVWRMTFLALMVSSLTNAFCPTPTATRSILKPVCRLRYNFGFEGFSESSNATLPGDDTLLEAYEQWRTLYDKGGFDPQRFDNFCMNYKTLLSANAATARRKRLNDSEGGGGGNEEEVVMTLNEFGDYSVDEYKHLVVNGNNNPQYDTNSNIRNDYMQEYVDWCHEYGKEFDESRLPIFQEHYANALAYFQNVGKPIKLNQYADMTSEQYNTLQSTTYLENFVDAEKDTKESLEIPEFQDLYASSSSLMEEEELMLQQIEKQEAKIQARLQEIALLEEQQREHEEENAKVIAQQAVEEARQSKHQQEEQEEANSRLQQEKQARLVVQEFQFDQEQEARLKAWQASREEAEQEARQRRSKNNSTPPPLIGGSYMGAVAKTYQSRSEYLQSLQASTDYLKDLQESSNNNQKDLSYDDLDALTGSLPASSSKEERVELSLQEAWEEEEVAEEEDFTKKNEFEQTQAQVSKVKEAALKVQDSFLKDEQAARQARKEAQEWMKVQQQLEEQAELATKRRQQEEEAIEIAREQKVFLEKQLKEQQERQEELERMEEESPQSQKGKEIESRGLFNFWGDSKDITDVESSQEEMAIDDQPQKVKKAGFQPFSFFGNSQEEESLPLEEKEPSKGFFDFFALSPETEQQREAYQRNQKKRQAKTLKAQQERAKYLQEMKEREAQQSNDNLGGWFSRKSSPPPKTLPTLEQWIQNEDGTISGEIDNSQDYNPGAQITTSPVRGKAKPFTQVTTISGSSYQLLTSNKASSNKNDLFNLVSQVWEQFPTLKQVAVLENWRSNLDGTITGTVSNKPGFNDGARITTSPLTENQTIQSGRVVQTRSGGNYRLE